MILFLLIVMLILIWMGNYIAGKLLPPKAQRGVLFLFFAILSVIVFIVLFKILKSLFVIAVPMIMLLTFLVVTRRK